MGSDLSCGSSKRNRDSHHRPAKQVGGNTSGMDSESWVTQCDEFFQYVSLESLFQWSSNFAAY